MASTAALQLIVQLQDQASAGLKRLGINVENLGKQTAPLSERLQDVGRRAAVTGGMLTAGLTLPLVGVGLQAMRSAGNFQQAMNVLQVNARASGKQMEQMKRQAIDLGAKTVFSASDAANAMLELSKSGFTAGQTMKAISGVLDLAAAGNIDLARAAEIASNAINAFGLDASYSSKIANQLAAAANASSVEVGDIADSMKMASAVFASFQGPVVGAEEALTDLNTAIAILGNVGIKGSDAGTSLKQMMLQLTGPSQKSKDAMQALWYSAQGAAGAHEHLTDAIEGTAKERGKALSAIRDLNKGLLKGGDIAYDAAGNMRSLSEIVKITALATRDMTDEQRNMALTQVFGADATRAIIALMQAQSDEAKALGRDWDSMRKAVTRSGAATEVAKARMRGINGAIEYLRGSIDSFLIGEALPFLDSISGIVRAGADALTMFSALPRPVKNAALAFAGVLASAGPLVLVFGALATAAGFLLTPLGLVIAATAAFAAAWVSNIGDIQGRVLPVIKSIWQHVSALGSSLKDRVLPYLRDFWDILTGEAGRGETMYFFRQLRDLIGEPLADALQLATNGFGKVRDAIVPLVVNASHLYDRFLFVWSATGSLNTAISDLVRNLEEHGPAGEILAGAIDLARDAMVLAAGFIKDTLIPRLNELWDWLETNIPKAIDTAKGAIDDLKPLWNELVLFFTQGLFPALQTLDTWLRSDVPSASDTTKTKTGEMQSGWVTFVQWVNATLIPTLQTVRNWLRDDLPAALKTTDKTIKDVQPAWNALEKFWLEDFTFAAGNVYDWLQKKLPSAHDTSQRASNNTRSVWSRFTDWLNTDYAPTLAKMGQALRVATPVALRILDDQLLKSQGVWRRFKEITLGQVDAILSGIETFVDGVRRAINWIGENLGIGTLFKGGFTLPRVNTSAAVSASTSDRLRSSGVGPSSYPQGQTDRISAMAGQVWDLAKQLWQKGPSGMLDAAMRALGIGNLQLPGALGPLGQAIVAKVKEAVTQYLTSFLTGGGGAGTAIPGALRGAMLSMFKRVVPVGDGFYANRAGQLHGGVDLLAPGGAPFYALTSGRVLSSGWHGIGGNAIVVQAPSGRRWYAGHFMGAPMAAAGQLVRQGQWLATVGSTGWSSGPHVHFQVSDLAGRWIDPMAFFRSGQSFKNGGLLREDVAGVGLHSGQAYRFHAPEYVVPKGQMGGDNYHVEITINAPGSTAREIGTEVRRQLRDIGASADVRTRTTRAPRRRR